MILLFARQQCRKFLAENSSNNAKNLFEVEIHVDQHHKIK